MENRFGVKDFILFLLVGALIVLVIVAMKQFDRQWLELDRIKDHLQAQNRDIRSIQEAIARGVPVTGATGASASTQPGIEAGNETDPFARVRAAQMLPDYAKGGWLIDAFGNTVGTLTPIVSSDAYASQVQNYVLESLATRDPDTLEYKPLLARDWQITDNTDKWQAYVDEQMAAGRTEEEILQDENLPPAVIITFQMRQGPQFSDGTPVTPDDVVFSYDFIMDPKINAPRARAYYERIKSVEKTGPEEVTFTFREPYFEAFDLAAGSSVLPKHFYSQFEPEDFNQSVGYLMGSGPYKLPDPKSWKPGTLIQLVRNDRYWGVQPAFDRMVFREISSDIGRQAAFRNGDIDVFPASPEQYTEMSTDAGLVERTQSFEYQNPVGGYRYIAWNQKNPLFADKGVRQALTLLLDRNRMIQEVMLGYAIPATGPFNPLSDQYNKEVQPWPYDVARAKQLLADAGFIDRNNDGVIENPDGLPFRFKLTYPSSSANYEKMALFLKDSYARAGIVLEPDPLDWSVMVERLNNKSFAAITLAWTAGIEGDIFQMFHSSQRQPGGDNFMNYASPELDRLIEQARRTIDKNKRMELWRQAHQVIHEDVPYTFLFFPKSLVFLDDRIRNVEVTRLGLNGREEWFVPLDQQRQAQ